MSMLTDSGTSGFIFLLRKIVGVPLVVVLSVALLLSGCAATIPPDALKMSPTTLEDRQLQTRRYEDISAADILSASVGVLQDLGFSLEESETDLGVLVGSKDRSAVEAGQVVAAVLVAALGGGAMAIDKNQRMRASLVVSPLLDEQGNEVENQYLVRVTFQRLVWNTQNQLTKIEGLRDEEIYIGFFDRLNKAVFLEGYKI